MQKTSAQIRAEIIALESEYQRTRNAEISAAKEQVFALMRQYDLTVEDIRQPRLAAAKKLGTPVPAVFRNDDGQVWSGRGRAPKWIDGKDREQFRIRKD